MTPKEALEIIRHGGVGYTVEKYNEAYGIVFHSLTELEELKRDVKRYFELRAIFRCAPEELSVDEIKEFDTLNDKLWELALKDKKVGKEK